MSTAAARGTGPGAGPEPGRGDGPTVDGWVRILGDDPRLAALVVAAVGSRRTVLRPPADPPTSGSGLTVLLATAGSDVAAAVTRWRTGGGTGRLAVVSDPAFRTPDALLAVLAAGADGWLTADLPVVALRRALAGVARGEPGLARGDVAHLIAALRQPVPGTLRRADGTPVDIGDRATEVMRALAVEPTTRGVARRLGVSEGTVRWHVARLVRTLQLTGRAELVTLAAGYAGPPAPPPLIPAPRAAPDDRPVPVTAARVGWPALSSGERRTARLVARGLTNREIAEQERMSRHTVDTQVKRAFAKLGVRSRVELTRAVIALEPAGPRTPTAPR